MCISILILVPENGGVAFGNFWVNLFVLLVIFQVLPRASLPLARRNRLDRSRRKKRQLKIRSKLKVKDRRKVVEKRPQLLLPQMPMTKSRPWIRVQLGKCLNVSTYSVHFITLLNLYPLVHACTLSNYCLSHCVVYFCTQFWQSWTCFIRRN